MRRKWSYLLWGIFGISALSVLAALAIVRFHLLPIQEIHYMDFYTGNLRLVRTCLGVTLSDKPNGNFSSMLEPQENLESYVDPSRRDDWQEVDRYEIRNGLPYSPPVIFEGFQFSSSGGTIIGEKGYPYCGTALWTCAYQITDEPVLDSDWQPPFGFTAEGKRQLLLNCLQIARETKDPELVYEYKDSTVYWLYSLGRRAGPSDIPDIRVILDGYDTLISASSGQ